jgi:hypothetical protein
LVAFLKDDDPSSAVNKVVQKQLLRTEQRRTTEVLRKELGIQASEG